MTELEYRDMANEIRSLVPLAIHPRAIADLRALADLYERRARRLAALPGIHPAEVVMFRPPNRS
jgi:hypothetical protein